MNLNLYEHQSTYNPNMTLRLLIYLVEIIKPIIKDRDLFGRRRIMLPTPRFAVFYNGMEKRPAIEEFRLSDSFENAIEKPELELVCRVYNINPGYNDELLGNCKVLFEYTSFIEKVRQNQLSEDENPIENAINYCIDNNILRDFLSLRGPEVINAMTIDMTFERREELIRRDVFAEGVEKGIERGFLQGQEKLIYNALQKGKSPEEISEFIDVPLELVLKVQEEMLGVATR